MQPLPQLGKILNASILAMQKKKNVSEGSFEIATVVPDSFSRALKSDTSNFQLQINFCCLMVKHYIWLRRFKRRYTTQNTFLNHLKNVH